MTDQQPPTLEGRARRIDDQFPRQPYDDEIDLLELWRALMRGKWIIIAFTAAFSTASVFYALSLPNMYKSTAVLAPNESSGGGGLGKLAGQFGGLASLAGINLGGGGSNKTAEALEILQSWAFIEEFIQEQNIAPEVFAVKGWNRETNELIYDTEIYNPQTQAWTREPPKGKQAEPSSWELYKAFRGYIAISEKANFKTVSITHYSPEHAKEWVDRLVAQINKKLKQEAAQVSIQNIKFLERQVEETNLASMQGVFYNVIEEQTKNLMLAKGSAEYVFKTVSAARVPEEKSGPMRAFICIALTFLGCFIGSLLAVIWGLREEYRG